jgi:hypothetical protein
MRITSTEVQLWPWRWRISVSGTESKQLRRWRGRISIPWRKELSSMFPGPTFLNHSGVQASNLEDQCVHKNIASLVFVELDCIQFDYIRIYQNISEYIRIYQNISEYIRIHQNTSEYIRIYQNIPENPLNHEKHFKTLKLRLKTHLNVYFRLLIKFL